MSHKDELWREPLICSAAGIPFNETHIEHWKRRAINAADALTRSEKENAELREALRPFGEFGQMMLGVDEKDDSPWVTAPDETPVKSIAAYGFTFGTYRTAARALTK